MLTDGALRMLVLLNFHLLGFSPIQLAYLFLIYEFMGILTNFFGGWLVNRFGLIPVLYSGLTIQVLSLLGLVCVRLHLIAYWLISIATVPHHRWQGAGRSITEPWFSQRVHIV